MRFFELLESRTMLAYPTGFAASASLSLDGRESVKIQFTAPLSADPTLADFHLIDRATGEPVSTPLALNIAADRKSILLSPFAANSFPDGDYQLTLDRLHFEDAASNPLDFDLNFYFFILKGDLNRDHQVSISDFITLASNVGKTSASYADGDINFDGQVSIADFAAVSANFGKSFTGPGNSIHLNAGGAAFTDSLARPFAPESGFLRGAPSETIFDIPNFTDDPLYTTYHSGRDFSFSRPIESGNYTLWLEFAEPTFSEIGQRTFDVFAEGRQVLNDFDIVQDAGLQTPYAQAFNITITDGSLDLAFRGEVGDAIVSSIVLLPTEVPLAVKPYSLECASDTFRIAQTQRNLRVIGQSLLLYANDNKGHYPADIPTLFAQTGEWFNIYFSPRTSTRPPRGQTSNVEQQAVINTLNDYISLFVGKNGNSPADEPVAYENPDRTPGPISIVFNDGSVRTFDRATAAQILGIAIGEPSDPPPPRDFSNCDVNPQIPRSADNLRRLAHAFLNYANDNRGTYPLDLGTLYKSDYPNISIADFLNPRNQHETPPPNMTVDQTAAWINANSDYIYFGSGRRMNGNSPAAFVLLAERPGEFTDGVNLLFNDATVEFRELRWADETLKFTEAQLPPPRPAIAPLSATATSTRSSTSTAPNPSSPHRHHRIDHLPAFAAPADVLAVADCH
jgi:hypothetical protein